MGPKSHESVKHLFATLACRIRWVCWCNGRSLYDSSGCGQDHASNERKQLRSGDSQSDDHGQCVQDYLCTRGFTWIRSWTITTNLHAYALQCIVLALVRRVPVRNTGVSWVGLRGFETSFCRVPEAYASHSATMTAKRAFTHTLPYL